MRKLVVFRNAQVFVLVCKYVGSWFNKPSYLIALLSFMLDVLSLFFYRDYTAILWEYRDKLEEIEQNRFQFDDNPFTALKLFTHLFFLDSKNHRSGSNFSISLHIRFYLIGYKTPPVSHLEMIYTATRGRGRGEDQFLTGSGWSRSSPRFLHPRIRCTY